MRTNLTLSTQVLSKNTTEIVNTCIEKLYKQVPYNFRNSLQQAKIATAKVENTAPLRALKIQEQNLQRKTNVIKRQMCDPTNSNHTDVRLLQAVMNSSKKRTFPNDAFEKKLSKRPSKYKIYGSKRFGSSASSSSSSLFRRHDDRQRLSKYRHTHTNAFFNDYQQKHKTVDMKAFFAPPIVHRNQTMTTNPNVSDLSKTMKNDLMVIDEMLKNRLKSAHTTKITKPPHPHMNVPNVPITKHHNRHEEDFVRSILTQQKEQLRQFEQGLKTRDGDGTMLGDSSVKNSIIDNPDKRTESRTDVCFTEKNAKRIRPLPFLGSILHSSKLKHMRRPTAPPLQADLDSQSSKSKSSFASTSSSNLSSRPRHYNKASPSATAFVALLKPSRFNRINHITSRKFT